ncbi:MAG: radical SAM protein [Elusimicrobia bacterium]|nr:radical SAM protein [Elusimicrobiota bacterium]
MNYRYLFGPVLSRRLGLSLGVDIIPFKTCTSDCVYCECGPTSDRTNRISEYIDAEDVIFELKDYLSARPGLDYITFSGGGEPTLNSGIGRIIEYLKKEHPSYKVALLTNGTLLHDSKVRSRIKKCDLVIPSLDAVSKEVYFKINRPFRGMGPGRIIEGIKEFRKESDAAVWVEIFIVPGVNDTREELELIKKALLDIKPDMVQLNTLDRPGIESWVKPASDEELACIKDFLKPLDTAIVKSFDGKKSGGMPGRGLGDRILSVLKRRPCTMEDLKRMFPSDADILENYLQELRNCDKIKLREEKRGTFYIING